jgi:ATP diphosphatase
LLFSVVNYARHLGIDSEAALLGANRRFEQRFRKVESLAERPLADFDIDALEKLWEKAKRAG